MFLKVHILLILFNLLCIRIKHFFKHEGNLAIA